MSDGGIIRQSRPFSLPECQCLAKLTIGRLDLHWTKCQEQKTRSSDAKRLVLVWWRAQLMADGD
jgi:hypothetical protein